MTLPKHYQLGFNTCDYKDSQEKVDTSAMQEITVSGVYVGTLSGGFLSDYQSKQDGTPGTMCQVTFVTDDNKFSRISVGFLYNGQYTKLGMAILMLAQDPFGQKSQLFPRITEGEKDGRSWYKLDDADGLRVTLVLFVNGTYQSSDGSVHPKTEVLGIFDGNGHSPAENRVGRQDTAALNSRTHWLKQKLEGFNTANGGYQQGYQQQQAAPQQWAGFNTANGGQQAAPAPQQWQAQVSQPRQPSPTQSLDMAVAANERAMAQYRNQQTAPAQQQFQPQAQWAGFNAPPPQTPAPDPRMFAIPQGQQAPAGGKKQKFKDDELPF